MMRGCRHAVAGLAALLLTASVAWADNPPAPNDQIDVGIFTAVEGKVAVTHPGIQKSIPVKLQDGVLFKDVIETEKESRTKALLNDDSILTVGEHSRVEITEHIYDPNKGVRSVVVNLVKGQVRALVGKVFSGSGSKFEIHTPAAVAAARGTYFVVFHISGVSGIVNVGSHGHVEFFSGGRSITVPPGQFSVTPPGGGPPSPPTVNTANNAPSQVTNAVQGTEVKDNPKNESPKQMAMASGGTAPVSSPSSLTPPGVSGGGETTSSSSSSSSSSSNTTASTTVTTPTTTTPTTVVSVPAVTSGAASPPPPPSPPPSPPGGVPTPIVTNPPPPPPPAESPPPPPPPPPPSPPPPSQGDIGEWFKTTLARLLEQFNNTVEKAEKQEDKAIAKAESVHEQRIRSAEAEEAERIKQALEQEKKTIAQVNEEYKKTVVNIEQVDTTQITALEKDLKETRTKDNAAIASAQQSLASVNTQIAETQKQIADLNKQIADLNQNPSGGKGGDNRNEKGDTNEGLHLGQLKQLQAQLAIANAKLLQLQQSAVTTQAQLAAANLKLQQDVIKLQAQLDTVRAQLKQDLAKVEEKLQADLKRAAALQDAKEQRAKAIEAAKLAKAALIEQARIARAQTRELAKVDRSGDKFVQRVSKTGDQYLAKLQNAGASSGDLEEARLQINKAISNAEARVKLAQQNAVRDDIVFRTTRLSKEHETMRKFGRFNREHENFQRRHRLAERQRIDEREYINKKR